MKRWFVCAAALALAGAPLAAGAASHEQEGTAPGTESGSATGGMGGAEGSDQPVVPAPPPLEGQSDVGAPPGATAEDRQDAVDTVRIVSIDPQRREITVETDPVKPEETPETTTYQIADDTVIRSGSGVIQIGDLEVGDRLAIGASEEPDASTGATGSEAPIARDVEVLVKAPKPTPASKTLPERSREVPDVERTPAVQPIPGSERSGAGSGGGQDMPGEGPGSGAGTGGAAEPY